MGQRQSYLSRVSTVLGLVLDLLGLVMGAMITLAVRTVAPSAKSAPMCWRSRLYRGAAHRLQRCRCATYWQAREKTLAPVSPCPARATFHHCQGCRRGRQGKQSVVAARPSRAQRSVRMAATTKMRLKLSAQSTVQLPRRSSAWRQLPLAIAGIALLGILAFAVMFMVSAWTRTAAQ